MINRIIRWLVRQASMATIDQLYAENREKFLRAYARESVKHYRADALDKAFVTHEGIQYYRFPKHLSMPLERIGKVQSYISWMARGLSPAEQDRILDTMEKVLVDGLTKNKGAAKIGALIEEMRDRKNMTVHTELIYNFLAIQYIRQDENPEVINHDMHSLKIQEMKDEVEKHGNTGFFFAIPELKPLLKHLDISEEGWNYFWNESVRRQLALKEFEKSITSANS